jgi:hypothetical protein
MKLQLSARLIPIAGPLVLAACIPAVVTDVPEVHGRVLDSTTGLPIRGAQISAQAVISREKDALTTTDADGRFAISRHSHTEWVPLGGDLSPTFAFVQIEAHGYAPMTLRSYSPDEFPDTIRMTRRADGADPR